MRRVLLVAFVAVSVNIVTTESATAGQLLFLAPQFPCGGPPLSCFPGAFGLPVAWEGPNYVPINLPTNSLIEQIDLWGVGAQAAGIWDGTTLLPPLPPVVVPRHEVAAIAPGSIDVTTTLFGIDGINGAPYFFYKGRLHTPIFLPDVGRYSVGVAGFGLVGASDVVWHSNFATDVDPSTLSGRLPGMAIQVVGQVVPEPATFALFGVGLMLLCLRRVRIGFSTRCEVELVLRKQIGVDVRKLRPRIRGRVYRGCVEIGREQLGDIDAGPVEIFLRRGITETRLDRRSIDLNGIVATDENAGHCNHVRKRA